ncbi:hypothetical protein D3C76_1723750 [compost metagenome]
MLSLPLAGSGGILNIHILPDHRIIDIIIRRCAVPEGDADMLDPLGRGIQELLVFPLRGAGEGQALLALLGTEGIHGYGVG